MQNKSFRERLITHRIPPIVSIAVASIALAATVFTGQPLNKRLANLTHLSSSANSEVFSASPNPIPVCDESGVGNITLSWNVAEGTRMEVYQDGGLVTQGTGSGSQALTNVEAGSKYVLYSITETYQLRYNKKTKQWERDSTPTITRNLLGQVSIQHTNNGCAVTPPPPVSSHKLLIRTSHSLVEPGGYYILYASEPVGTNIRAFNGQLDYKLSFCPASNPAQCTDSSGPWLQVSNGQVRADLPATIARGIYKAQFRPSGRNDVPWSEVVQVNVGNNVKDGLENMAEYWIMPNSEKAFEGINHITGQSFQTVVGYRPAVHGCSWMPAGTKEMYFIKNHKDGYWQPNYDTSLTGDGGGSNLLWYIAPWAQGSWDNKYLSASGHRGLPMPDPISLNLNDNFRNMTGGIRYGSEDSRYPGYILAPEWVGPGYGVANNQQIYFYDDGGMRELCQVNEQSPGRATGTWVVHIDKVALSLPKYQGSAIRISFWEFIGSDFTIKEQWYFVKGKGLVRIEQKIYSSNITSNSLQCATDPDCYNVNQNPTMTNPMTEMTLQEYMR